MSRVARLRGASCVDVGRGESYVDVGRSEVEPLDAHAVESLLWWRDGMVDGRAVGWSIVGVHVGWSIVGVIA